MKPLQTHGQYNEKWIPPKPDRFTIYESSDESWLRPLGFGLIEKTLERLYDVRTGGDMRLVGYCRVDPTDRRDIRLGVVRETEPMRGVPCVNARRPIYDEITLGVRHYEMCWDVNGCGYIERHKEVFLCWHVEVQDVEKLLSTTWLTFGGDNLHSFVLEIRREMYERRIK